MMRLNEIGQICAAGILLCYETSGKSKGVARMLNPLSAKKKMHLKISSAEVFCCKNLPNIITDKLSIEANSVDPEQTAPIGAV